MSTVWVKTTSHRARERLLRECSCAGLPVPSPCFRRSTHPCNFRQSGEFWELPAEFVGELRVTGVQVLKHPIPSHELIRPLNL